MYSDNERKLQEAKLEIIMMVGPLKFSVGLSFGLSMGQFDPESFGKNLRNSRSRV